MTGLLVTVVTSTWGRPRTVAEHAIASVARQTHQPLEHIIVTDGYNADLNAVLNGHGYRENTPPGGKRLVFLGRNWSSFSADGGYGATCRMVGAFMAAGDLITYLDDDNDYTESHISGMARFIVSQGVDFITGTWRYHSPDGPIAGAPPPGVGRTDTGVIMHRAELLKTAGSFHPDGYEGDGRMAERFVAAGASWAFRDEPTFILNPYRHGAPEPS